METGPLASRSSVDGTGPVRPWEPSVAPHPVNAQHRGPSPSARRPAGHRSPEAPGPAEAQAPVPAASPPPAGPFAGGGAVLLVLEDINQINLAIKSTICNRAIHPAKTIFASKYDLSCPALGVCRGDDILFSFKTVGVA